MSVPLPRLSAASLWISFVSHLDLFSIFFTLSVHLIPFISTLGRIHSKVFKRALLVSATGSLHRKVWVGTSHLARYPLLAFYVCSFATFLRDSAGHIVVVC